MALPAATVSLAASAPTVTYGQAVTRTARVTVGTQPRANVAVRFCGPGSQACTVARTDKTGTARLTVKPDRAITYTAAVDAGADYGARLPHGTSGSSSLPRTAGSATPDHRSDCDLASPKTHFATAISCHSGSRSATTLPCAVTLFNAAEPQGEGR